MPLAWDNEPLRRTGGVIPVIDDTTVALFMPRVRDIKSQSSISHTRRRSSTQKYDFTPKKRL